MVVPGDKLKLEVKIIKKKGSTILSIQEQKAMEATYGEEISKNVKYYNLCENTVDKIWKYYYHMLTRYENKRKEMKNSELCRKN